MVPNADKTGTKCHWRWHQFANPTLANKRWSFILSTRIDQDTKLAFTHICDEVGLSLSQALKLFVKAVINYGGIPFGLRSRTPNSKTLEAIKELESGAGTKADNVKELFNDLGVNES